MQLRRNFRETEGEEVYDKLHNENFNLLRTNVHLNYIKKSISYLTENTFCVRHINYTLILLVTRSTQKAAIQGAELLMSHITPTVLYTN
jgi:hypothetical protein